MLAEYKDEKIRRAGNIIHYNFNNVLSFKKYGLNKFKNFLNEGTIFLESEAEMNRYTTIIFTEIAENFLSAALFFDLRNGHQIIYEMFYDCDDEDNEPEPYISRYEICDPDVNSFAQFDFESNYELYGLLVYKGDGMWKILDR